jgi:hypothetical protein
LYRISPDREGSEGATPLHLAALCGCPGIVRLLLRHGANRDARTGSNLTPAECARGRMEKVRFIGIPDTNFKLCKTDLERYEKDLKRYEEVLYILEGRGVRDYVASILTGIRSLFS